MEGNQPTTAEPDRIPSLALLGREVATRFRTIEESDEQPLASEFSAADWKHEAQRFSLWADNLGLHHWGHSSLDYRLREAGALEAFVKSLLKDLKESLEERTAALSACFNRLIIS